MSSQFIERKIAQLLRDAGKALNHSDWNTVVERARNILALAPENEDANALLAAASRVASNHPTHLSGRELEILALLLDGMSDKEIAARLVISRSTVETHVAAIKSKLGATSRAQLAAIAVRLGILPIAS